MSASSLDTSTACSVGRPHRGKAPGHACRSRRRHRNRRPPSHRPRSAEQGAARRASGSSRAQGQVHECRDRCRQLQGRSRICPALQRSSPRACSVQLRASTRRARPMLGLAVRTTAPGAIVNEAAINAAAQVFSSRRRCGKTAPLPLCASVYGADTPNSRRDEASSRTRSPCGWAPGLRRSRRAGHRP